MALEVIEIETGSQPSASIIVLHGLGADGNDFVPFAEELDLARVGAVRFVFPHAPLQAVTVNGGHVMRAWYDLLGEELVQSGKQREDERGVRASQVLVEALIARERARGVSAARIVLAGFSQGCAIALMTGLRHEERLAGILGMSGYLPLAERIADERHPANADVPIFQAHGTADPMIPISRAIETRDTLLALGHRVEWHAYPMGHSVCAQEIVDINRWLLEILAPPRP
jgi:phospholipase/carboxylesterase